MDARAAPKEQAPAGDRGPRQNHTKRTNFSTPEPQSHSIAAALTFIPPDDRDLWVRMGMAAKSALGEDGFGLWDDWSQGAESYRSADARAVWKSIQPDGPITVATLFFEARKRGYSGANARLIFTQPRLDNTAKQHADAALEKRRARAARMAEAIWKAGHPAGVDHSYLTRKGVKPTITLRELPAEEIAAILGYFPKSRDGKLCGRVLIAPICIEDRVASAEFIDEAGRKSAIAGGAKAGGYWTAQSLPEGDGAGLTLLIAEGIATALTAREATGHPAIAALSCHNLRAVARYFRRTYPKANLIVLGDIGRGAADARDAALEVDGRLAIPRFSGNDTGTDFNDLATARGLDAVRACIAVGGQR